MKINMFPRLNASSLRCGIAAVAIALCASASAGQTKKTSAMSHNGARVKNQQMCYVQFSGTAFPQPCERLGAIPSTAIPMTIIGEMPVMRKK